VTNIKLTKTLTVGEAVKDYDRKAHFYLNVDLTVAGKIIKRSYNVVCPILKGKTTATVTQNISSVDKDSSNVKKYLEQYALYHEKLSTAGTRKAILGPQITALEEQIKNKEERIK
jgi:hypothetical protein